MVFQLPTDSVARYETDQTQCTAFSIDQIRGYFVSAKHCNLGQMPDGIKVKKVSDDKVDLMLLESTTVKAPALKIATTPPKVGDEVRLLGYPVGFYQPATFFGHVSMTEADFGQGKRVMFHEGGGPGMSGGPVLNKAGEVISVIHEAGEVPSVVVFGSQLKDLREFTDGFRSR